MRRRLRPFEQAPRPLVGYAIDYNAGNDTGWHQHPRAQLLHAIEGVLRVETEAAQFVLPPGTGLWMPARTLHVTRMPPGLRMRALFLREDAARAGPGEVTVVAISPLLRESSWRRATSRWPGTSAAPQRILPHWRCTRSAAPRRSRCRCRHVATGGCDGLPTR